MVGKVTIFVAVIAFCALSVSATTCLGRPFPVGLGGSCDPNNINSCSEPNFCNKNGICVVPIAYGQPCDPTTDQCVVRSTCKGPTGQAVCVKNAGPGQVCSNNPLDQTPACGGSTVCISGYCKNGQNGDSCTQNSDCVSGNCNSNVCQNKALGASCNGGDCLPGTYCSNGKCTSLAAPGAQCLNQNQCSYGTYCLPTSTSSSNTYCVANQTLSAGMICGSNNGEVCQNSKRCYGGSCAQSRVSTCTSASDCSSDEICMCDGKYSLVDGLGSCVSNPCYGVSMDLYKCAYYNCGYFPSTGIYNDFDTSCIQTKCQNQVNNFGYCGSASSLAASFTLVIAALVALFSIHT